MTPVPVKLIFCLAPVEESSRTVSAAWRVPVAEGVKVMVKSQATPAAKVAPQVVVSAKSVAFAPTKVMLVRLRVALPVLVRVMVWGGLVVFFF